MIELRNLTKTYGSAENGHHALRDVSLKVERGDIFGIIGQSGAGKSTLVRCINLLERPTSGSVLINGENVTDLGGRELIDLRRGIGMIFQNFSLFQQRSALGNVMFPLELQHGDRERARSRSLEMLDLVGLSAKADSYPSQLSGGQQQRVAIARALATGPSIMLCDEATSALDTMTTRSILDLLESINGKLGVTIVLITHSLAVARRACDKIAVIDAGRIVEEGPVDDVLENPQATATRALLGSEGQGAR